MARDGTLGRYAVLRNADVDGFRTAVSRYLTPHQLTPLGRGATVRSELAVASLGPLSLVYGWHRGAELGAELTEQVDYYDVNLSWGGRNRITCGADEVVVDLRTAGIISPRMRARMSLSSEYRQLHVRVERHALDRHLEELLGRPIVAPIRFTPAMDLRMPAAASWSRAVRLLVDDLDAIGLTGHVSGATPWSSFLMTGLLLAQSHNYSGELESGVDRASRPSPLKRAIELIETHPETDLSVGRIATQVGVDPRSLQRHFRDHVGVSPHEYVRQIRLTRVREDLLAADPVTGVTVAEVAFRWGFGHVPRFAAFYRERYGEAPATTLRQCPVQRDL
ncbi:AraC family transcriptional regulator [Amycolatopsis alba]|uniref:AraC family transcriptional regulator n=1 Tax=Amycolatopsis alba TaxID=76020 RepID=UPI00036AD97A|nr:AraC family transcriptional regulator [Amycolatopsis alba]